MTRRRVPNALWFTLLAVGLALAGYFGFHALFVKVGQSVEQPLAGPAKTNQFYVFQRYLEERGLRVRNLRNWPQPLATDVLVVWFSQADVPDDLKTWTSAGGQLWTTHDPDRPRPSAYAWTPTPFAGDPAAKDDQEREADSDDQEPGSEGEATAADDAATVSDEELASEQAGEEVAWSCDDGCLTAAQFRYGSGYLTLVDSDALQNDFVSRGDTPARVDALLSIGPRARSVLFVTQLGSPWFGALLLEHAPHALIALALLLLLTLWRAGTHFGAKLPPQPRARRQMLEHVAAVGMLASRVGLTPLIDAARRELQRQVQLRVPHGTGLAGDAFASAVASAMNVPSAEVQRALLEPFQGDSQQAVAIARAMQALWRKT